VLFWSLLNVVRKSGVELFVFFALQDVDVKEWH